MDVRQIILLPRPVSDASKPTPVASLLLKRASRRQGGRLSEEVQMRQPGEVNSCIPVLESRVLASRKESRFRKEKIVQSDSPLGKRGRTSRKNQALGLCVKEAGRG